MDVLTEAAKQIPSLVVLVWVVYAFLTHLNRMRDRELEGTTKLAEAIDKLRDTILLSKEK